LWLFVLWQEKCFILPCQLLNSRKKSESRIPKELPFFSLQSTASIFQWRKAEQRDMEKVKAKTYINLKTNKKKEIKFLLKSR